MKAQIRKVVVSSEVVYLEAGRPTPVPIRTSIAAAVLRNPWFDEGYVDDLDPAIAAVAPELAEALVPPLIEAMGGPSGIEAFGKAAVVGLRGEIEHASALIHTLRFGNRFRSAAEGDSYLSFSNKRGAPGCVITLPLVHKQDRSKRSHFLTTELTISDAPMDDEIVVAIGASSSGRPFARIGDRHQDMATGRV